MPTTYMSEPSYRQNAAHYRDKDMSVQWLSQGLDDSGISVRFQTEVCVFSIFHSVQTDSADHKVPGATVGGGDVAEAICWRLTCIRGWGKECVQVHSVSHVLCVLNKHIDNSALVTFMPEKVESSIILVFTQLLMWTIELLTGRWTLSVCCSDVWNLPCQKAADCVITRQKCN